MVGDAAGVAGAGVGAEGLLAGMDGVAREQKGDPQDLHPRERGQGRGYIDMVDEVPFAIVLDGADAAAEKVHMQGQQGRLQ